MNSLNSLRRPRALALAACVAMVSANAVAIAQSEPESQTPSLSYDTGREVASAATVWSSPAFRQMMVESWLAESDIEPKTTTSESRRLQRIFDQLATEEPAKIADAESRLNNERGEKDSSAVFDFTLGQILFQRDDLAGAKAAFEDAVRKFPKFRRAWRSIGVIEMRTRTMPRRPPRSSR
jgi:predicted Zn-dependent protease